MPGAVTGLTGSIEDFGAAVTLGSVVGRVRFATAKRTAPTVTVYDVNGVVNTITTFNPTQNNNQPPTAVDNIGQTGFKVFHTQASVQRIAFHWVASTGL